MRCDRKAMLLYAVTNRKWVGERSLYEQVERVLKSGATCIQLREKNLNDTAFLAEAIDLAKLCKQYRVPFIINDNVSIALQSEADGIHVGQGDMLVADVRARVGQKMIVGVSAHTVAEAQEAVQQGADYLGLGAVFATDTKTDTGQMSYETLKAICHAVPIPTVAIGGISLQNMLCLCGSGVDGVAAVSAIFGADDPGAATAKLLTLAGQLVPNDR